MFATPRISSGAACSLILGATWLGLTRIGAAELVGVTAVSGSGVHPRAGVVTHRVYLLFDDERDQLLAVAGDADVSALWFETAFDGVWLDQSCTLDRNNCPCDFPGTFDGGGDSWVTIGETIGDTRFSPDACHCPCVVGSFFGWFDNAGYFDADFETPELPDAAGRILIAQFSLPDGICFSYMGTAIYRYEGGDLYSQAFDLDQCLCRPDIDRSGVVDSADLLRVLTDWGRERHCPPHYRADLDQSCRVDFGDLAIVLAAWGPCPSSMAGGH